MTKYLLLAVIVLVLLLGLSAKLLIDARADTKIAQTETAVATAGADAAHDAAKIVDRGHTRDLRITVQSEKNQDAILHAPGADATLDPSLVATVNDGLCSYRATPGCDPVLGEHPGKLPPPGAGRDAP